MKRILNGSFWTITICYLASFMGIAGIWTLVTEVKWGNTLDFFWGVSLIIMLTLVVLWIQYMFIRFALDKINN